MMEKEDWNEMIHTWLEQDIRSPRMCCIIEVANEIEIEALVTKPEIGGSSNNREKHNNEKGKVIWGN